MKTTPIAYMLLESEEARQLYMNSPWFHRIVQTVRVAECQGVDPMPVLRDCLAALCVDYHRQSERLVAYAMREAPVTQERG